MKIIHIASARGGPAYWDEDGNLRVKSSLSRDIVPPGPQNEWTLVEATPDEVAALVAAGYRLPVGRIRTSMSRLPRPVFTCQACGHSWRPRRRLGREPQPPRLCPQCGTPRWRAATELVVGHSP